MDINITTPSLLFPATTFLLMAYTSRFLALGARIRTLHEKYLLAPDDVSYQQIISLRRRVILIKYMQGFGVFALFLCTLCIFVLFFQINGIANFIFGCSIASLLLSLAISLVEIHYSMEALNIELADIETFVEIEK